MKAGEGRLYPFLRRAADGNEEAMRGTTVVATLSLKRRGHNWSFSSTNSVVPRRAWFLSALARCKAAAGKPGIVLLAGVRGEDSPQLTIQLREI